MFKTLAIASSLERETADTEEKINLKYVIPKIVSFNLHEIDNSVYQT